MNIPTIISNLTHKNHIEQTLDELVRIIYGPQFFAEVMELIDNGLLARLKDLVCQ